MSVVLIILALIVGVIFLAVTAMNGIIEKNQGKLAQARVDLEERFGPGDYHVELPDLRCIGINWTAESLILGDTPDTASAMPLTDVRAVDIEIDGVNVTESRTTTRTNRGSQLVGGAIGGALLGPAGLVVGGLSGGSTSTGRAVESRKIKTVKLVIRVNDRVHPLRSYLFVHDQPGMDREATDPGIKESIEKAAHFHALLTQVIEDRRIAPAAE